MCRELWFRILISGFIVLSALPVSGFHYSPAGVNGDLFLTVKNNSGLKKEVDHIDDWLNFPALFSIETGNKSGSSRQVEETLTPTLTPTMVVNQEVVEPTPETVEPPTDPMPVDTPLSLSTPTQEYTQPVSPLPAATETPAPNATSDLTQTPTPTATETPTSMMTSTPENIPIGFSWSVEINVPVPPSVMDALGGPSGVQSSLENQLNAGLAGENVAHSVEASGAVDGLPNFKVAMQGDEGLDQLKKAVYGDLSDQINFLGGPIDLIIKGYTQNGEGMPLILESNPSTGYIWDITNIDSQYLVSNSESQSSPVVASVGSPLRQTFYLQQVGDGQTILSASYRRPWEGTSATRKLTIETGYLPEQLDLSNPNVETPVEPDLSSVAGNTSIETDGTLVGALPTTFDWRNEGKVTSVKNQGSCGSCWAFATVGVMEAAILRQSGVTTDLSEQYLVSCNQDGYSCDGGWYAHDYHINRLGKNQSNPGAVLESDLPYSATNGTCTQAFNHSYRGSSWSYVAGYPLPSVDSIKQAINDHGPVAVGVCSGSAFSAYRGGVFTTEEKNSACSGGINHAVVLTGWDDSSPRVGL
ncbi:MAG: C1 family peptidase [Anaerolineaceae bacterium]